jgi:amino acid adenylation domain-containing protein
MIPTQTAVSEAEAFWRQILDGCTVTPLPAALRAAQRTGAGGRQSLSIRLSPGTASQLQALAQSVRSDVRSAILAAWAEVLGRYGNQDDVLFGFALKDGPLAPIRLRLDTEHTVESALNNAARLKKGVAQHGAPPASQLREWAGVAEQSPLFETAVVFDFLPREILPLIVRVSGDAAGELELAADYDAGRFAEGAVANVLDSLAALLDSMAHAGAGQRFSELSLIGAAAHAQLARWNDTAAPFSATQCMHEFFEEQARRTPAASAVTFQNHTLTYEQLDRKSNQLARHLQWLGAGPDQIVAVCLERSVDMMVALLGILKSGAAYLPLDPAYPHERLEFMLQDSGALLLVTAEHLLAKFPESRKPAVKIDSEWSQVEAHADSSLGRTAEDGNLAYVIYTSGSTGKPKGVMIEHRQVSNFFTAMDRVIGAEPGAWLAVTSISFDISVLELFWTLASGFHVVLQAESDKLVAQGDYSIPAQIARYRVTHMQCTPSMARLLAAGAESRQALAQLEKLLVGGEAFPASLAAELASSTAAEIHNMYGPTETTIWSTTYRVSGREDAMPIGRPIANTYTYIVDRDLKPLPIGAPGELCIGGDGVVRGYLHRPELTAERFPLNPFRSGERMYRTGDLARFRPDGEIEFLGRIDNQIKISGFRVELEEIEAVLGRHPDVRAAAVITREDVPGEMRLAAYVVAADPQPSLAKELRIYLNQKLPPHMVPSSFAFLDALPFTPNGKINRKALGALAPPQKESVGPAVTPAALEEIIAGIWKEILGVDEVSPTQNIFDLGATSLTTIEAASRLREACHREIAVTELFQHPTIRALAAYLVDPANAAPVSRSAARALSRRGAISRRSSR